MDLLEATVKTIVYTAGDQGIDGREPMKILYASFSEPERDAAVNRDPSKNWRTKGEQIVDIDPAIARALAKLDGIDRLVLGLPAWPAKTLNRS